MINSICLMVLTQFLIFRITLNLSSKNTKLQLKILRYIFTRIKSKQDCFQSKNRLQTRTFISENDETISEYKRDVDKDKDGENIPKLETAEVVLGHCNLVNNSYQELSKVLFTFVPNKQFRQLITISPHLLTMLKTSSAEFQSIQVWFTDQNNRPLKIEHREKITLIIGQTLKIKMRYSTEPKYICNRIQLFVIRKKYW